MRTLTKVLAISLLPCVCFGAQVIRYVDTDAGGAANGTSWTDAYTALETCLSTEETDLVAAGNYLTVYCRSGSGTDDSTPVTITTNWTTGAANYIEIIGDDFPSDGVLDGTKYILAVTASGTTEAIDCDVGYVYLKNIQIQVTTTGSNNGYAVWFDHGSGTNCYIERCILRGVCSGTGAASGVVSTVSGSNLYAYATTIYDFESGSDAQHRGFTITNGTVYAYNVTVWGGAYIFYENGSGAITATNCIGGSYVLGASNGSCTLTYCCLDGAIGGTGNVQPASLDWDNELTDANNGDFTIVASGNCEDGGTDNPGSGLYSTDIRNVAFVSPWDIGAYNTESAAGAGQVIPAIVVQAVGPEPVLCVEKLSY